MKAVKVDEARRIQLGVLTPGDLYETEIRSPDEIALRRVPQPRHLTQSTNTEVLHAIEESPLKFSESWEQIREETRE